MKDEKKLIDTFDFKSNKARRLLQKAKIFILIRTSVISLIILILLCGIIVILNTMILNHIAMDVLTNEQIFDLVARPNIYMSQYQINDGFLAGELDYVTYRIVGNRAVYNGTYKISYNSIPVVAGIYGYSDRGQLTQIEVEDGYSYYNKVGLREMSFYHPYIEYKTYQNDLIMLDKIGENKYLEMSLSFDKDYSLEEVQSMFPSEVKLAWYWVNTYSEEDLNRIKGQYVELIDNEGQKTDEKAYQEPKVLFAHQIYGMKGTTSTGEIIKNPYNSFIEAINAGLNRKYNQTQFKMLFDKLRNGKEKITKDDIRIIGVVVTCDTTSMKLLKDLSFIKASTLGTVIDKF